MQLFRMTFVSDISFGFRAVREMHSSRQTGIHLGQMGLMLGQLRWMGAGINKLDRKK